MLIGLLSKPRLDRSPGWLHILQRLPTLSSYDASHSAERSAMPIFYIKSLNVPKTEELING